jgi:uncharacterized SAM-binding protein YcdF (DUF218 family)
MFFAAKVLALLTQPLAWVIGLLSVSLLLTARKPKTARTCMGVALAVIVVMGWQPAPDYFLRDLESHYPEFPPQADLRGFAGVVVLGGSTEAGHVAQSHSQALFTDAGERLTAPVIMLRYNPHLHIVYSGGEGTLLGDGPSEAERARVFFDSMGLTDKQVQYESASRNTYENAVFSARLPGITTTQPWLLLTSASHMPRAMGTFTKAGWRVTAYPVDFRTGATTPWLDYSLREGTQKWQMVLHEWLGILSYRLTGRL